MKPLYSFNQLIGNTKVISLIKRSLQCDSFKNFTILDGVHGTGKTTSSQIIAMFKTCEDENKFKTGEPCMKCKTCMDNYKALCEGHSSNKIQIYDIGQHTDNIHKLITELFKLQNDNVVYILDEVHRLDINEQTALLCEIEKEENTTIIMNTTKAYKLLPELRSRARIHRFKDLTNKESLVLIDKIDKVNNLNISDYYKNIISKGTKGIPRQIINDCIFVGKTNPSEEELMSYYSMANKDLYIGLMRSASLDLSTYKEVIDGYLEEYDADTIIRGFQDFLLDVVFRLEGSVMSDIGNNGYKLLCEIGTDNIMKMINLLDDKSKINYEKSDLLFILINIRNIILKNSKTDIVNNKYKEGYKQSEDSRRLYKEMKEDIEKENNQVVFTDIDINDL